MIKNNVKNISIKKAAFINAAANYSCVILQLGFSAVLARILLPEDYGVIGVMTVFTTFFSVLANMGIGTAVIQDKELSDYDVSNIFTFNLYVAVGLSIIFAIFSVPFCYHNLSNQHIQLQGLLFQKQKQSKKISS